MKKLFIVLLFLSTASTYAQRQVILRTRVTAEEFFDDAFGVSFNLTITNQFNSRGLYHSNSMETNPWTKQEVVEVDDSFTISSTLDLNGCNFDGHTWEKDITPQNFHGEVGSTTGACGVNGYVSGFYLEPHNDNSYCKSEPIELKTGRGWQYQLVDEGNTWYNFGVNPDDGMLLHLGSQLNIAFEDISNNYNYTGPIRIRGNYFGVFSNIIQLTIIPCSHELVDLTPIDTLCSDSNDGSFIAYFDRELIGNEEIQVTTYLIDENQMETGIDTQLVEILDQSNSYQWDNEAAPLPPGTYYIKYQTAGGQYPGSVVQSEEFEIEPADAVTYSATPSDIKCYGGSDGSIQLTAFYGTGSNYQYRLNGGNWTNFANQDNHTITGLFEGDYTVEVRDGNECMGVDGNDNQIAQIRLDDPQTPIALRNPIIEEPIAFGFTDGSISVEVEGGTPGYSYEWKNQQNNIIDAGDALFVNQNYQISLENIPAGTYTLTIWDSKYAQASSKTGCTTSDSFVMGQPPQLQLNIQESIPISCNSANTFNNPSNDGQLTAVASGGVPFNPLIDGRYEYIYSWKKKNGNNVWQVVPNESTNVLNNVDAAEYSVNIEDANGIVIGVYVNNQLQQYQDIIYVLEEPDLLEVDLQKTDVYCFSGMDGTATVSIIGGTPPYDIFWVTGESTNTIENLFPGNYWVQVTDARGCQAEGEINIGQPAEPVSLSEGLVKEPLAFGFTNGSVMAHVTGGTPYQNNSYDYQWTDENNNILNTTSAQLTQQGYEITLEDIPAGIYTLTVTDANYNIANQKEGCTYSRTYEVGQPDPLEVAILPLGISCNSGNAFNNPSDDGQLTAIGTGGVQFEPPIDGVYGYIYTWKKKDTQGIWQIVPNETTDVLLNITDGEYAVNIEDANGIVLGNYINNLLQEVKDSIFAMREPELLTVDFNKTDVSCFGGDDGTAEVLISGGITPYTVRWTNGSDTKQLETLTAGTYVVYVMDIAGCELSGQVTINEPEDLIINVLAQNNPTCNDANDGSIQLEIMGGQPPYTYSWNTGESSLSPSQLSVGTYTFTVTDAQECTESVQIELATPLSDFVGLGEDRILCKDQSLDLDISIDDPNATYVWTSDNGFQSSSATISITEAGFYTARITTGLGCVAQDNIRVETSNIEIDSQFLITTQAFAQEELVLVNTSSPLGISEDWIFPEGVQVIEQDRGLSIVRFDEPGVYDVTLRSYQNDCYQDFTKSILVSEARQLPDVGDAVSPFIQEFKVSPNPSNGTFTTMVSMQETATISLRLFGLTTNVAHDDRLLNGSASYQVPYSVNLPSGVYLLLLETPKENQIRKIVIL
nr:hypothetical protein [uncultured Allomuricauda sp.]